jgi:hypothetical protein
MFESGIFDGFFFMGPTPRDIFKQYTAITGSVPLPPVQNPINSFILKINSLLF